MELSIVLQSPTITPESIARVRETWALVAPIANSAADLFYQSLFALGPCPRLMFLSNDWGSAATQARAYAQSGGLVADKIEQVASTLEALGSRHASYGVQRSHYDTIGKALIATLERGLGEAWTVKAAAAWREAYDIVAGAMRRAPVRAVSSRTGVWSFGAR